jgi:flagellar biosynthesis protein FliQ
VEPDIAVDFGREAVLTCLTLAAPVLIVAGVVAIVVGIVQSMTQIQDQAVSFIPKIVLIALTLAICLPWMADRLLEYSREHLEKPGFISTSVIPSSRETGVDNEDDAWQRTAEFRGDLRK